MVVDGELGMPLDLLRWDCLWDGNGDDFGAVRRSDFVCDESSRLPLQGDIPGSY